MRATRMRMKIHISRRRLPETLETRVPLRNYLRRIDATAV